MNQFTKRILVAALAGTMVLGTASSTMASSSAQAGCYTASAIEQSQSALKKLIEKQLKLMKKLAAKTTIKLNGVKVKADLYIDEDGLCYMTLEDVARLMKKTGSKFSVEIDENNKQYQTYLGKKYKAGQYIESEAPETEPESWTLYIDGVATQMVRSCESDGKVYFNLNDISVLYGFDATYNAKKNVLKLKSDVGYPLDLNTKEYETGSINVYGEEVTYKVYTAVSCTNPDVVAQEVIKIYVPDTATEDSPVIFPLKTGAHMHAEIQEPFDVDETNINTVSSGTVGTGGMELASYLMSKGWVVLTAAGRGYDTVATKDGVSYMAGTAPSCIVDFKSAIRFLQYNDDVLPGDPDKIVITGTSGGGTMTSVMGASGNSEVFDPYLEAIGAADEEDDVYVAMPYCPVADIDNMGMAYEWVFNGNENTSRNGNLAVLNTEIAKLYVSYVNGLGLTDEDGNALTLDPETLDGTYKEYFCEQNAKGLTYNLKSCGYVAEDGSLTEEGQTYFYEDKMSGMRSTTDYTLSDIFTWNTEDGGYAEFQMDKYQDFINVYVANLYFIKGCPSYDNGLVYGDVTTPSYDSINQLFNTDPFDLDGWRHFEMNLGTAVANANDVLGEEYFQSAKGSFEVEDEVQLMAAMYNPMYYIKDYSGVAAEGLSVNSYADDLYNSSDVAPYWHVRVGTWDHLVSTSTETTLSLTLAENPQVQDVDFMIYWAKPHTGWYDNSETAQWLAAIPGLESAE